MNSNVTHYAEAGPGRTRTRILCPAGSAAEYAYRTTDPHAVTCKHCRKALGVSNVVAFRKAGVS